MAISWVPLDPERISAKQMLEFRNSVLGLADEPSNAEIKALESHLDDTTRDDTMYNLVAIKGSQVHAWVNGKFSQARLTDMIRMIFFDASTLGLQEVDNLIYQLELSLPFPYRRIEIYGLGPGRENDLNLIMRSGYRPAWDISYYQWTIGAKPGPAIECELTFENVFDIEKAYEIYRNAFQKTWNRDMVDKLEFESAFMESDERFSFMAYDGDTPAGMVIVNRGLKEDEAFLQVIAVVDEMKRKRVGDTLVKHLLDILAPYGIKTLTLSTYTDNETMRKLLQRWTFVEYSRETVLYKEDMNQVNVMDVES